MILMMPQVTLLDFFDKLYIINLPERADRRKQIQQELRAIGISDTSKKVVFFRLLSLLIRANFPVLELEVVF